MHNLEHFEIFGFVIVAGGGMILAVLLLVFLRQLFVELLVCFDLYLLDDVWNIKMCPVRAELMTHPQQFLTLIFVGLPGLQVFAFF